MFIRDLVRWGALAFLPTTDFLIDTIASLQETALSYQDRPERLLPSAHSSFTAFTEMGPTEHVRFPGSRWTRDGEHVDAEGTWPEPEGPFASYHVVSIDGDYHLIVSGPKGTTKASAMGQCGAFVRRVLAIWYFDRSARKLLPALLFDGHAEEYDTKDRIDVDVSPDRRLVRVTQARCRVIVRVGVAGAEGQLVDMCTRTIKLRHLFADTRSFKRCAAEEREFDAMTTRMADSDPSCLESSDSVYVRPLASSSKGGRMGSANPDAGWGNIAAGGRMSDIPLKGIRRRWLRGSNADAFQPFRDTRPHRAVRTRSRPRALLRRR
jgi:hypothetical protein